MKTFLLRVVLAIAGGAPAAAAEKVVFHADWFTGPQFAGLYVAEDRGFFRAAGLEVEFVPFKFGLKPTAGIAASSTCALGAIEGYIFLQQRAAGSDVHALAAMLQESPAGFMSLPPAGIASARDFAGKRIGVHAYADPLYHWFLRRTGVPESAVTLVPAGNDLGLLTKGDVQALQGYATEEFVRLRQLTGGQARFLPFRELGFDSYSEILYTTAPQLERHRAAIDAFVAAARRGWAQAFAHPDDALASLRARLGPTSAPRWPPWFPM
jgi:ABC-type nitrate/sulfonate/bicarbonate transport system substrate-binding protein